MDDRLPTSFTADDQTSVVKPTPSVIQKAFSANPFHRQQKDVSEVDAEATALLDEISQVLKKRQLEDIQHELGRLANLIPNLQNCEVMERISYLRSALFCSLYRTA